MSDMEVNTDILKGIDREMYVNNEYYFRDIDENTYLLTTRFGSSIVLTKEEFDLFREHKTHESGNLYSRMKENGFIVTRDNARGIIRKYKSYFSVIKDIAGFHEIMPTYRCNLNCKYCHANSLSENSGCRDMDLDVIENIAGFILNIPLDRFFLSIQGGEPLLRYDLVQQLYYVMMKKSAHLGKKISFSIQSNGTLLDEDIAKDIIRNNIGFGISLDGPKELHDHNRITPAGKGTYDTVVRWIRYFRDAGKPAGFIPVVSNKSLEFSARDIIDEYLMLGNHEVYLKPIILSGRAGKHEDLDPEKYFEFWRDGVEYILNLHKKGIYVSDKQTDFILKSLFGIRKGTHCYRRPCGAGITGLIYDPDGKIQSCVALKDRMPPIGNVREDDYDAVASRTNEYKKMISEECPLCDTCVYCSMCPTCPARSCREKGILRVDTANDFMCRFSRQAYPYLLNKMKDANVRSIFKQWATHDINT